MPMTASFGHELPYIKLLDSGRSIRGPRPPGIGVLRFAKMMMAATDAAYAFLWELFLQTKGRWAKDQAGAFDSPDHSGARPS